MQYIPKNSMSFGILFNYPEQDLSMSLAGAYTGSVSTTDYRLDKNYAPLIYTYGISSVDFTVQKGLYKFGDNGDKGVLSLKLSVNNMFDNNNEFYLDYPGPGRNFYVGLKYEYK
jgi:vitamin B12 transporter